MWVGLAGACVGPGGPRRGAPAHHLERGFRNLNPAYTRPSPWVRWPFVLRRSLATTFWPRRTSLPVVDGDRDRLRRLRGERTVTWVGHATLLLQLGGVNLLTDPQWSDRASPLGVAGPRRLVPPGVAFEDLPRVHVVVISHDHYDHLDVATVRRLQARHRPRFLVPLGYREWFRSVGIPEVEELDWWERRTVEGLELVCVPAQHWTSRAPWEYNLRLWSGWVVAGAGRRFFFAGDTGYHAPLFREIGERLGPFDLVAVPIGAYAPRAMMRMSHTTPEEALDVLADVRGDRLLPIHWGTFDLADEPPDEPPRRLLAAARARGLAPDRLWVFRHGETRAW